MKSLKTVALGVIIIASFIFVINELPKVFVSVKSSSQLAQVGGGTTYYVSITGNDSNSGSQSAPFRTIQRCANVAQAGDTCLVSAGTYNENISTVRSGTASGKIYIKGASGNAIQNFNLMFGFDETCGLKIFSPVFFRYF